MSITIAIPSTIEQQLRDDAARQGVSLEQYIAQVLISGLSGSGGQDVNKLREDELLQLIHLNIQPQELEEYYHLVDLRKSERLSEEEYEKLIALTNRIEMAHAERLKYVAALARLRGASLEQTMIDLGLQKKAA